jgi:hypothetical protein
MMTVRQMERHWNSQSYQQLLRETLAGRPEASLRLESELSGPIPAAAMALLRLDELAQGHAPLYAKLLKTILASQDADGGWKDPLTTALCLRALFGGRGQGVSIDRSLEYLSHMQKPEGIWPKVPIRRFPADAFVSAFILLQIGADSRFRDAVHFDQAISWFELNQFALDVETRRLWDCARRRLPATRQTVDSQRQLSWS